jgi:hypothetical protein
LEIYSTPSHEKRLRTWPKSLDEFIFVLFPRTATGIFGTLSRGVSGYGTTQEITFSGLQLLLFFQRSLCRPQQLSPSHRTWPKSLDEFIFVLFPRMATGIFGTLLEGVSGHGTTQEITLSGLQLLLFFDKS